MRAAARRIETPCGVVLAGVMEDSFLRAIVMVAIALLIVFHTVHGQRQCPRDRMLVDGAGLVAGPQRARPSDQQLARYCRWPIAHRPAPIK